MEFRKVAAGLPTQALIPLVRTTLYLSTIQLSTHLYNRQPPSVNPRHSQDWPRTGRGGQSLIAGKLGIQLYKGIAGQAGGGGMLQVGMISLITLSLGRNMDSIINVLNYSIMQLLSDF